MRIKSFAFTITELLVVVIVVGILAGVVVVSYGGLTKKAYDNSLQSNIDKMADAQEIYSAKNLSVAGKAYYYSGEGDGYDADLDFRPSEGNVIDVVVDEDGYCVRGYASQSSFNAIDNSIEKESSEGTCNRLSPSAIALGIETVTIGSQIWMKNNLNSGVKIPAVSNFTNEGSGSQVVEKHCKDNDDGLCSTYGGWYSWNEVMGYPTPGSSEGARGACPIGFHVPSNSDFVTLSTTLGGNAVAGGKMKEAGTSHWLSPNTDATNSSGFTALPAGEGYNENFSSFGQQTFFWSSTDSLYDAYYWYITTWGGSLIGGSYTYTTDKNSIQISVRCIKD